MIFCALDTDRIGVVIYGSGFCLCAVFLAGQLIDNMTYILIVALVCVDVCCTVVMVTLTARCATFSCCSRVFCYHGDADW